MLGENISTHRRNRIPDDPEIRRERLLSQNETLLEGARTLARAVSEWPNAERYGRDMDPPRALIVGGFIRDALLGLHPKDLDIEVYGMEQDDLLDLLRRTFRCSINLVGESYGVIKVPLAHGLDLDVSVPRTDSIPSSAVNAPPVSKNPWMTVREAARRRDFTMNTLAADPLTGEIIDSFGAIDDLNDRLLRATDRERFQDDALRVYRGVQFAARMGLEVEDETFLLMREMVERGDLKTQSAQRRLGEWAKLLLKAKRPSIGLTLMRELGMTELHYPQLHALIGVPQDPEWHPEGDVWIHTLMVVDAAAQIIRREAGTLSKDEQLAVMMGVVCHDFGKPETTEEEGGHIRSRGHEEKGVEPTKAFLKGLRAPHALVDAAAVIAGQHLKPGVFYRAHQAGALNEKQYRNILRKLVKNLGTVSWRVLLAASEADFRGRDLPGVATDAYLPGELFAHTVEAHGLDREAKKPLLQGRDLEAIFDLEPGRQMGTLIRYVEKMRDEGQIETKEEAVALVRAFLGQEPK